MIHKAKIYKFKIVTFIVVFVLMSLGLTMFSLSENTYSLTFNNSDGASTPTPTPSGGSDSTSTPAPSSSPKATNTPEPTPTEIPSPTPSPTLTPTPTPVPNDLQKNAFPEVNELVEKYYNAKLTCALSDFDGLVNSPDLLDIEAMQKQYEYVKAFSNFNCYTKTGIDTIEYVVFVNYDTEIATIDTPVPSLDRLLVMRDAETGKLVICLNEPSASTAAYIEELQSHDDFIALFNEVTEDLEKALESDEDLKSFYERLQ